MRGAVLCAVIGGAVGMQGQSLERAAVDTAVDGLLAKPATVEAQTPVAAGISSPPPGVTKPGSNSPVTVTVYDRTRMDVWQFFSATPHEAVYPYVESLVRIGVGQTIRRFDWDLELTQPTIFDLPSDAVSKVTAQGQLGLGGTYYASNGNNQYPAAAGLKQGWVRYRYGRAGSTVRLGRFEFFDGQELTTTNKTMQWLQTNRIAQRLIGNFGFSAAQRSFDGVDAHYAHNSWELTGMAARSDQGVYNMNVNPELNTDLQYVAYSRKMANEHLIFRTFALGYHDGRPNVVKTDNRALAVRTADHRNLRLGTYGADVFTTIPAGKGSFDLLGWGVLQNGQWGALDHHAGAATGEAGYKFTGVATQPWIRGGFFRGTGDTNPNDGKHNTFFQVLTTPRNYARFPFYNLMNSSDQFVQVMDAPTKKVSVRSDLHFLQLTSKSDLWYSGGGAFDAKVFGYTGRPANGHRSFASVSDLSAEYQVVPQVLLTAYYAHAWGKSAIAAIYPREASAQYGYMELVYRWGVAQRAAK